MRKPLQGPKVSNICKQCQKPSVKVVGGYRNKLKGKSGRLEYWYVDQHDRRWMGTKCPTCRFGEFKPKPVKLEKVPELLGPRTNGTVMRKCHCGNETVNRFNCTSCLNSKTTAVAEAEYMAHWGVS